MAELFDTFPYLESNRLIIKQMVESDLPMLKQMTDNDNVYRYIPPLLYKKSNGNLLCAIRNVAGRDFDKKKYVIAGIYLQAQPNVLVGLAEIFDYKRRKNQVTIGYRFNEDYWHQGIATETVGMLIQYLTVELNIDTLKAFVMPANIYSSKALLSNGFRCVGTTKGNNWGGQATVTLNEYTYTKQ